MKDGPPGASTQAVPCTAPATGHEDDMSNLHAIRLAAVVKAFERHLSALRWHRHCAARGHPNNGRVASANATARYDKLRAFISRRDGIRIVAGQPLDS